MPELLGCVMLLQDKCSKPDLGVEWGVVFILRPAFQCRLLCLAKRQRKKVPISKTNCFYRTFGFVLI